MFKSILNKVLKNTSAIEKVVYTPQQKFVQKINSIETDIEKILEFEKHRAEQKAFVIINKTKSQADVYRDGKIIDRIEVGVGETFGDDLNTVKYANGVFENTGRTTPAGEFITSAPYDYNILNKNDYVDGVNINMFLLRGVQHPVDYKHSTMLALHEIPQNHLERDVLFDVVGTRRSMSTGCVNFRREDFKRLASEIKPTGTPVYILPEETGNFLELVSLPNGMWFKTKYADKEKNNIFEQAFRKFFRLKD